jgi:hypothetical protein
MKILFYHINVSTQRVDNITYEGIQTGTGFSGTETALFEVCNFLVKNGHEIIILGMSDTSYTTNEILIGPVTMIEDNTICDNIDIVCPIFFVGANGFKYILSKMDSDRTRVWLWSQLFIDERFIQEIKNDGFDVIISFLAPYVREKYNLSLLYSHVTIGNAIGDVFLTPLPKINKKRQGNWIFHASFERGGRVALDIMERVRKCVPNAAKKIHIASYYTSDHMKLHQSSAIEYKYHGSLSKQKISDLLSETDYFVYPLVHDNGTVHHDTYGTVMLEALARGVIVVTWNVACIPSVYGEHVVTIDPNRVGGYDPNARFGNNSWMLSDEAKEMFVDKIKELEANPVKKEEIRTKGIEWARTQTWDECGKKYLKWLTENCKSH